MLSLNGLIIKNMNGGLSINVYDLVVIGWGSAGYSAAMTAERLGKKVCLIEKGPFGGLCILKGCMPSKTLLYSARLAELMKKSHQFGVYNDGKLKIDMHQMISRKNKIIKGFADYREEALKSKKIDNLIFPGNH